MERTFASSSSRDLSTFPVSSSSSSLLGSSRPTRPVKIIPLQHPNSTTSSSLNPLSLALFSRWTAKIKRTTLVQWIDTFLPCCRWIRTYKWREHFQLDLMAGLTVGIMLVPQAMSYAKLAGLHPIYGLYTGFVPIFVYAIFGSSRQLAVGPVALVSLLVSNVLGGIVNSSDELYTELAILLAFMVGILECTMALLRLGWLIRFISHSVISGFTSASAIVIALSQAKYFLGYDIVRSSKIVPLIKSIISGAHKFSWPPFVMGSCILAILLVMKHLGKSRKQFRFLQAAGPLTAVVLGTLLVKIFHPSSISLVGEIPQGLPSFSIPKKFEYARSLIPTAMLITGVAILESVGIAKALAAKNGYELDSSQEAFIMKLAWGLMNDTSLWVKFLKDKYMSSNRRDRKPVATARDSVLWKAICQEWDVVHQNVSWNLGDGKKVLFWKDRWLESSGPLINHVNPRTQVETINYTVADMVDNRGNWKWDIFAHLLPVQVLMGIVGFIPPRRDENEDLMVWDQASNGRFTVRTAYMVREEGETMNGDPIWKIIKKWKGMERIKVFLWTVAHNAVMTNDVRWQRRITDNRCCSHCVNEVESVIHVLRDCPKARKIWEVFVKIEEREVFFSQNWYTWLISNLSSRKKCMRYGEWQMVFGIALWYIWKERCNRVFGGDRGNWFGTTLAIKRMNEDSQLLRRSDCGGMHNGKDVAQIGWKYPADGWIKLNVDGCSKGNPGLAGAGGVIRDHIGTWIGGFARNIGVCSSMTAELWAIYSGLQLVWDKGFRKVILESDSRVVVGLINGESVRVDRNYNILMQIKNMLGRDWEVVIAHVYREANCVADWLANFGLTRDLLDRGADIITDPPAGLYILLYYDLIGSTVHRLI